jgi:c-di-GMP-binding flagellar brake protein YcgR
MSQIMSLRATRQGFLARIDEARLVFDSPVDDPRGHPRVGDALLIAYSISEDVRPEFTETYDIGPGGLAMLTNAELPSNLEITIELELRGSSDNKLRIAGIVRWSRYDEILGKYRTGVAFNDPDPSHAMNLLRYIDTIHRLRDLGIL